MFGSFKDLKKKTEELKTKLEELHVEGYDANRHVKVLANANRKILSIEINDSILKVRPKAEIEILITEALNNALSQAEGVFIAESKKILPKLPGLGD